MRPIVVFAACAASAASVAAPCRLALAQSPPAGAGSIDAALAVLPETPRAGEAAALRFAITDAGQPVEDLITHHDRKLHVVLVSADMQVFGHVHPQDFGEEVVDGAAGVRFTFPRPGRYLAAADLMTAAGPYAEQFTVTVAGEVAEAPGATPVARSSASLVVVAAEADDSYTAPVAFDAPGPTGGYAVSVARPAAIRAGEPTTFTWRLTSDGEPITDLRLFLAAPMHLAVVKDDFGHFLHGHGTARGLGTEQDHTHGPGAADVGDYDPDSLKYFGPEIVATVVFPDRGRYYLFGQAAHGERLLITRLPVDVR